MLNLKMFNSKACTVKSVEPTMCFEPTSFEIPNFRAQYPLPFTNYLNKMSSNVSCHMLKHLKEDEIKILGSIVITDQFPWEHIFKDSLIDNIK